MFSVRLFVLIVFINCTLAISAAADTERTREFDHQKVLKLIELGDKSSAKREIDLYADRVTQQRLKTPLPPMYAYDPEDLELAASRTNLYEYYGLFDEERSVWEAALQKRVLLTIEQIARVDAQHSKGGEQDRKDQSDALYKIDGDIRLLDRYSKRSDVWVEELFTLLKQRVGLQERLTGAGSEELSWELNRAGIIFMSAGRSGEGIELLKQALAIAEEKSSYGQVANYLEDLARAHMRTRQFADAEMYSRRSLAISEKHFQPKNREFDSHIWGIQWNLSRLAAIALQAHKSKDATDYLESALEAWRRTTSDAFESATLRQKLAAVYFQQQLFDKAETELLASINLIQNDYHPGGELGQHGERFYATLESFSNALDLLAEFYIRRSRYSDAEKAYRRILALQKENFGGDPGSPELLDKLGWVLMRQGKTGEGKTYFDKLIAGASAETPCIGPFSETFAKVNEHYGELLQKLGREEEAKTFLKRASEINAERQRGGKHSAEVCLLEDSLLGESSKD